jgi:hypothetical protein
MNATPFAWLGYDPNDPMHRAVVAYLTVDIQKSREAASELLEKIDAVNAGEISGWERIGNAYCLQIFPDCVVIEEDYADEPGSSVAVVVSLFRAAAHAWLRHISH